MNTQQTPRSTHHLRTAIRGLLPLGALGMPALALAGGPTGEVIVGGDVEVNRPNTNTTVIDQASWRAIVDWQSFNVGVNEYVLFNQPGTNAVILNRVVGGDPTSILGSLTANGQVFLVNPQGVFFGQNATLDVHGLLATTLDINNDDFMAGNYQFARAAGASDAGVVNEGRISADGGYVVLAADHVFNSGVVAARAGHVVMAAGSAFTLDVAGDGLVNFAVDEAALSDMAGVSNAGQLLADGGTVLMSAKVASDLVATAVNNEGLIRAQSIAERDGVIYLAAEGGDIVNAGTLDANGANGENGGHIRVLSDRDISLENGSVITAQGDGAGAGGTVRVIAEDVLAVNQTAAIYAQGGGDDNGGFVEVSGHGDFLLAGDVRVGAGGLMLIDPTILNIATGSGNPSYGSIGVGWIEDRLDSGSDVLLVATSTIQADPAVTVLTATGTGNLNLAIGTVSGTQSTSGCLIGGHCTLPLQGPNLLTLGNGGTINLGSLDFSIGGDFNATAQTGRVQLGNVTTTGGAINIVGGLEINTGALDAAGNITLDATGTAFTTSDFGITVNGNVDAGGSVTMQAYGNSIESGYGGGTVNVLGHIQAANAVTIETRSVNFGDQISISGSINAGGNVMLSGSSGSSNGTGINAGDIIGASISITNTRNLQTGRLTATASNVDIIGTDSAFMQFDDGSSGSIVISAGGDINISGAGTLRLGNGTFGDGDWFGQAVNAGGNISINAGRVFSGAMTATSGNINITASSGQIFFGSAVSGSTGQVFTYADVSAGGLVQLTATKNEPFAPVQVQVNNVTGTAVDIQANNTASYGGGALIRTGDVTATTGSVRLQANHSAGDNSVSINAGKITAATSITVEALAGFGASLGGHIVTGALSGEEIFVHHNGNKADITLGALTAINTDGRANIDVITGDNSSVTQAGKITVTGDITASGEAVNTSCNPSFENCLGAFGQPTAAQVQLRSGGGFGSAAGGVITVNGGIDITANIANVTVTGSSAEGAKVTTVSGDAGLASLFITGTVADVSGSISVQGPDAVVNVQADQVSFGAVSVTATGHDITLTHDACANWCATGASASSGFLSSTNNAGNAILRISGYVTGSPSGPPPAASTVNLGAVTVSGLGMAQVEIVGTDITTQTIAVSAAAANYDRNVTAPGFSLPPHLQSGGPFDFNEGPIEIDEGTLTAGLAGIRLYGGFSSAECGSSCQQQPANQLTVNGNLSVDGVGLAGIDVLANSLTITGAVTATAAAGTVDGTGNFSQYSGSIGYDIALTQQGSFGSAAVRLESGIGNINVDGAITVSGQVGRLEIGADSGTVAIGGVTVTGTGGVLHTVKSFTPSGTMGTAFSSSFEGPGGRTLASIVGQQVTIDGNVSVTGSGIAGLFIAGFQSGPVINGDVSVTATSATITEFDSRKSSTPTVTTYGDAAIILGEFSGSASTLVGPATINGSLTLDAARDAHLLLNADIRDELLVNAGRHIDTSLPDVFQDEEDPDALPSFIPLSVSAGGLGLTADGNIDFASGTLDVDTAQAIAVVAGGAVNFGAATLETTQLLSVVAGGSITNGSGSFTADGLALISNASINMGSTTFTVGDGVFPDIAGDTLLLLGLGIEQLAPPSSSPNATFVAADSVDIGALSVAGGYAWFETHEVTFNGAVTGPANLLVQFTSFGGLGNVLINGDSGGLGSAKLAEAGLNLTLDDLLAVQDGATIVIGTSDYSGAITIDAINIDGRNFVAATEGPIDSLDNITSTGKVKNLSELLAVTLFNQPTLDEINTDYYSSPLGDESETGEEEGEDTDDDGVVDTESDNALISHDSSGETKVCTG